MARLGEVWLRPQADTQRQPHRLKHRLRSGQHRVDYAFGELTPRLDQQTPPPMTTTLLLYIASLICLTAATFRALDTITGEGPIGFLPFFLVIGSGLLLLFGVLALLWRLSA